MRLRTIGTQLSATIFTILLLAIIFEIVLLLFTSARLYGEVRIGSWYLFSFISGLLMVILPTTLPLASVIVPMVAKRGLARGLSVALSFSIGVIGTLAAYGVLVAMFGETVLGALDADPNSFRETVYFFAGIFAYLLSLGEIGLIDIRLASYAGKVPSYLKRGETNVSAFLLGIFLGNIGVGSGLPAVPLLLTEATISGDMLYGGFLFMAHGLGRVLPLILLAFMAAVGINGLRYVIEHKERIERVGGVTMLFASAFLVTLGLFSFDWWANVWNVLSHSYAGFTIGAGLLGQPLQWGNWFLPALLLAPLWWHFVIEYKRTLHLSGDNIRKIEREARSLEEERRGYEAALHLLDGSHGERIRSIEHRLDSLQKERRIIEEALRYGAKRPAPDSASRHEWEALRLRAYWYATLTFFLLTFFVVFFTYA